MLVREVGARALDLPFRETLVCGLLHPGPLAGTPEQQEILIPRIVSGDLLVAPALNEPGLALPGADRPGSTDDRVTGRKLAVPASSTTFPGPRPCCWCPRPDAGGDPVVVPSTRRAPA